VLQDGPLAVELCLPVEVGGSGRGACGVRCLARPPGEDVVCRDVDEECIVLCGEAGEGGGRGDVEGPGGLRVLVDLVWEALSGTC